MTNGPLGCSVSTKIDSCAAGIAHCGGPSGLLDGCCIKRALNRL